MIKLAPLPYAFDSLEPMIDAATVEIHYTKHHQWYVDKLNGLIGWTEYEVMSLEDIIHKAPQWVIFNNAAQVWNHTFYREGLASPQEHNVPVGTLAERITATWWSFDAFKEAFTAAAMSHFWSGWVWLVKDNNRTLKIISTPNAATPLTDWLIPLLTLDVWEHAYYLKYQNRRGEYIANRWQLINWDHIQSRYTI